MPADRPEGWGVPSIATVIATPPSRSTESSLRHAIRTQSQPYIAPFTLPQLPLGHYSDSDGLWKAGFAAFPQALENPPGFPQTHSRDDEDFPLDSL
jgi:hypothetical protein